MRRTQQAIVKWLTPGLRVKRWLVVLFVGITVLALGLAQVIVALYRAGDLPDLLAIATLRFLPTWARVFVSAVVGLGAIGIAVFQLNRSILAPFTYRRRESLIDVMVAHQRRGRGLKVVAIGGGTGLPSVLRGMKAYTGNLTAIVTVADDGGSSGRLRRELGVLPPGDLRSNIAALADDEDLMTHLFQYRFANGGLEGHSLGNLFLTALADIAGGMDRAVALTERVLAVEGRVLPATLQNNVTLWAEVRVPGEDIPRRVAGESQIVQTGGRIEHVFLAPDQVRAFPEAVRAILAADLIVIGPGSLYTSILPTLLVGGITEAVRASSALRVYLCNVATQLGETDGYTATNHVEALEKHIGRGVFDVVLSNNSYPSKNAGENTHYVLPPLTTEAVYARYQWRAADLTDSDRPWRHDPTKLAKALLAVYDSTTQIAPSKNGPGARGRTPEPPIR
ncbi:MAG: YvcK family protein [Anaerolineae bacterium]|nr:YvcK family protein [Anaerolineae bacterium]